MLGNHSKYGIAASESFVRFFLTLMERSSLNTIFNVKALHEALKALDLNDVIRRTLALADDDSPGYAWLDVTGKIYLAESPSEIDGLILFEVKTNNPAFPKEVPFHISSWVLELGLTDFRNHLQGLLESETSK